MEEGLTPRDLDGAFSLSGMAQAVDCLSTSAPTGQESEMISSDFGPCVFIPGGFSYESSTNPKALKGNEALCTTLKQAKGTGRQVCEPNQKSYTQLKQEVQQTPGAEIRIIQSNEGLIKTKADKIRLKYYDSCRKMALAPLTGTRGRVSLIPEEGGECRPLLGGNHDTNSINSEALGFLEYPIHLLPSSLFHLHLPGQKEEERRTQSSMVTIMAIWNTMMGSSLLAVPWAIKSSGLAMGFGIVVLMTIISYYTAYIIIDAFSKHNSSDAPVPEFAQLCARLLGPMWEHVASVFSIGAVLGACIVYWVLMSTFLYDSVDFISGVTTGMTLSNKTLDMNGSITEVFCPKKPYGPDLDLTNTTYFFNNSSSDRRDGGDEASRQSIDNNPFFNHQTVPLCLIVVLPMISLKSPTIFTKFNSVGTINVFFLIGLVIFLGASWGINADFEHEDSVVFTPMYKDSFPSLSGMMALGLFIHNAIITIMKNNKFQENNRRDLAAGFTLVSGTYLTIGVIYFLTFPMDKECIEDNFLNNFHVSNPLIVIARILLLFQLLTVFPLIMFILRSQIFMLISKNDNVGYCQIYMLNAALITICVLFAIFMPSIGNIIRYTGALCGAIVVFVLPSFVYMASAKKAGQLRPSTVCIHLSIILIGMVNFAAQFFI